MSHHQMAAEGQCQDHKGEPGQVLSSLSRDLSIKSGKRGEFALGEFYHLRQCTPRSINHLLVMFPLFHWREDCSRLLQSHQREEHFTPLARWYSGLSLAKKQKKNFQLMVDNTCMSEKCKQNIILSNIKLLSTEMCSPHCTMQERKMVLK